MFPRLPKLSFHPSIGRGEVVIVLILIGAAIAFGVGMSLIAAAG